MTLFKAGFDAWRKIDLHQQQNEHYASALIELKQRVKALEAANEACAIEIIKLTNACAAAASNQVQFHTDNTADEDDGLDSFKPTSNPSKIRSSLVKRVAAVIGIGAESVNWEPEARAAIREVAAWLRERGGWNQVTVADVLEQEADRG